MVLMKWADEELNQSTNTMMSRLQKHIVTTITAQLNPDDTYNIYDWTADDEEQTVGTELNAHQVGDCILQFLDQFTKDKMTILIPNLKQDEVFIDLSVMDENDYEEYDDGMIDTDRQFHHIEVKYTSLLAQLIKQNRITKDEVADFNQLTDEEQWIVLNCQAQA